MLKALAVVRTVYLVFIVGYTIRALPIFTHVANTFDESFARNSAKLELLQRAAWLAVGWIAFDTLVGWLLAAQATRRAARLRAAATKPAPAVAPPPPPRA